MFSMFSPLCLSILPENGARALWLQFSTIHPNVVDENVLALTVVRSQLAWDSTYGNLPESTRASTRDRQAAARETDPNQ